MLTNCKQLKLKAADVKRYSIDFSQLISTLIEAPGDDDKA